MILEIKSKTDNGRRALEIHYKESLKMSAYNKALFYASGFRQELVSASVPFTIHLHIKNKMFCKPVHLASFKAEIIEALKKNGGEPTDYEIREIEGYNEV